MHIFLIEFLATRGLTFSASRAGFAVGETFLFGLFESLRLDEQTLPFIPLARPAPLENDRRQRRVLAGAPGKRGIAGRKKDSVPSSS